MAMVLVAIGSLSTYAAVQQVTTKMTYIDGSNPAEYYGEVEEAQTGYNKISGGAVELGNAAWGVNQVVYIQVDASAVQADITKVTLSLESSGSTDSKRNAAIGVGYNASEWSSTLTWETADRSITTLGDVVWGTSKSATGFEPMSFDITEAFAEDADKIVTILVYNAQAAGSYIKNVKAEVEYSKADEVLVSYTFNDAENPVVVGDGSNGGRGTCNYDYDSPINGEKFLNVWGENNPNEFKVATLATEDITSNGQWTLEFDWAGYGGCNTKPGQTKLVDLEGNTFFSIDDPANWNNTFTLSTGGTIDCYPCNKDTRISDKTASNLTIEYWHHFTVIGTAKGVSVTIEKYSKDEEGNVTKTVVVKNAKASATNVTPAQIGLRPGSCGSVAIDNLKLSVGDLKIVSYDYTVKFVDQNGDQVKADEVRNAVEGETLAATDEDKETIINGKTQYTYVSDDANDRVIDAEGIVLTITYNKTTVSDYVVNYVTANGTAIQEATAHKNVIVGTEVKASAGELSKILVDGVIYNYVSGNETITVAEDETKNVINLVFAAEEGVTGYYLATYETGATPWTTSVGGRFDPVIINGNSISFRYGTKVVQEAIVDEEGNPVLDEDGNPTYKDINVTDSTAVIEFANKTRFNTVNQASRNNNGAANNLASLGIDQADYTFEAKLLLGSSNDQTSTSFLVKNLAGDANILAVQQIAEKNTTTWTVNGSETTVTLPNSGTHTGDSNNNLNNYSWYDFKVTVYKGYTFVTITDEEGNAILDKKQVATSALTYGVGALQFNSSRYYANFGIDDILVRSVADTDIPEGFNPVKITVNYVDTEGNTLKPSGTVEFNEGDAVTLTSAYINDFKVDAEGAVWTSESESAPVTKYIYESDNSKEVVAEEGASVTVVFRGVASRRVAMRYQYQNAETGEMLTKDAAGTNLAYFYDSRETGDVLFEGDVQRIYYPYYLLVDGYLYKTGANGGDADHYDYTVPEGTSTLSLSPITWTPATEMVGEEGEQEEVFITNAVFAEESENIPGMTVVKDGYTAIRQANGAAGSAIGGDVLVTTLMPGKYTITTASRSGVTNFIVNGEVVCTVESSGTANTVTSKEFEVTKPTALYIQEQASTTQYSDYVLIRKTGDVEDPSYVVLSNYALACDGKFTEDEDGQGDVITVVVTYDAEIVGSYAESFMLNADFAYTVTDAEGKEVTSGSKNPFEVSAGTLNIYVSNLQPETEYSITITGVEVTDFDMDIFDFVTVYIPESKLPTLTFKTGIPTGIANVEAAPAVKADGKYLENGQIVIYRGGVKYNAAGAVIR